jgi:hypothetical protein
MRDVILAPIDNSASVIFVSTMTVLGRCVSVEDALRAKRRRESGFRTRPKSWPLRATSTRKAIIHENIFIAKKRDSEFARGIFCPLLRSAFVFIRRCIALIAMKETAGAQSFL